MLISKKIIGSLKPSFFWVYKQGERHIFMEIFDGLLIDQKTSAAEAEGRLLKSFGIGRLCSASVILCFEDLWGQLKTTFWSKWSYLCIPEVWAFEFHQLKKLKIEETKTT